MKTKHEILDEIASKYTLETRSVLYNGRCVYKAPDGKMCAFAMMLIDVNKAIEGDCANGLMRRGIIKQEDIKEEYRGHDPEFYRDCQRLHDHKDNWTSSGLSEIGASNLLRLKQKWYEPIKSTERNTAE